MDPPASGATARRVEPARSSITPGVSCVMSESYVETPRAGERAARVRSADRGPGKAGIVDGWLRGTMGVAGFMCG